MENIRPFRLGAGRYIQEEHALQLAGSEARSLGRKAFIISGHKEWKMFGGEILSSLREAGEEADIHEYDGQCSYASVEKFKNIISVCGADLVIGVGGGRNMDISKGVAVAASLPLLLIPTSCATCASVTPLSVMYKDDGKGDKAWYHDKEASVVLADERLLAKEPPRLLAAGMLDAMAKFVEIPNGNTSLSFEEAGIEKYSAYRSGKFLYDLLFACGQKAYHDVEQGKLTKDVHNVIFANIALTGMVSALMRGIGQTALAHNFAKAVHTIFPEQAENFLHGELVAIGMLVQLGYNHTEEEIPVLRAFMRDMGMPVFISDLELPDLTCSEDLSAQEGFAGGPAISVQPVPSDGPAPDMKRSPAQAIENYIAQSVFVPHTQEGRQRLHEAMKNV